jgi:hypothetical protein
MLRASCLAMTLLVLPVAFASAGAPPDLGKNAALKYWQGFASLPRFTDAEQKKLGECLTMALDAEARNSVARARYALDMMQRGAALPYCDWGIGYEEGVGTLLPYIAATRLTANLACLRARIRFEDGQNAEAIDDIIAAMTLGRRISHSGIYSTVLTSYAIEHRMSEGLALYVPKLDAKAIKTVEKRLGALPPVESLANALKVEEYFALDWLVGKIKQAKDKEGLQALLVKLCDSPEKGQAFFKECGGTVEGVLKVAGQVRQGYARVGKKLDLPLDQFEQEWDREVKEQAGNQVFQWIFPSLHKVRLAQLRADVRRALLSAALAVQRDGRDALKTHPDPVVGGSFEYVAFKGGFELRSKWQLDDKLRSRWKLDERFAQPLTLTVGRRDANP